MKNSFYISTNLIKNNLSHKDITALAIYIKLKGIFNIAIFYNYSILKLYKHSGISKNLLSKYIPILISKGFAHIENGNLRLSAFKVMAEPTKSYITVSNTLKVSQIIQYLRYEIIEKDLQRQRFIIDLQSNRIKASFKNKKKWLKKYTANGDRNIRTSYRRIASILNTSISTAYNILNRMVEIGYFKIRPDIIFIKFTHEKMKPVVTDRGLLMIKNKKLILIQGTLIQY